MADTVPLPAEQELEIKHRFGDVVTVKGYGPAEMHAHAAAQSAADNAGLRKQLRAAKAIIHGQDERALHMAREHGELMQRASDVAGERAANAMLTDEVDKLRERVRVLEDALEQAARELQACQAVIHLAGGFDPAYVRDAQAALNAVPNPAMGNPISPMKPLTDEQVIDLAREADAVIYTNRHFKETPAASFSYSALQAFARAIEAHHGTTGGGNG